MIYAPHSSSFLNEEFNAITLSAHSQSLQIEHNG